MPVDITITLLDTSSTLTVSDTDAALLSDLLTDPQVFLDQVIQEMRARLLEELRQRLLEKTRPLVSAYMATNAKTRADFDTLVQQVADQKAVEVQADALGKVAREG